MSSHRRNQNIFGHCARISPIKEIDWKAEYNLGKSIWEKLESNETYVEVSLRKKLRLKCLDLHCVFLDLALIVSRINEDGSIVNRQEELFKIAHDRMWTDEEEKEYESLQFSINYLLLDVKTLLVNIVIFMDVLAQFLSLCIRSEKQPKSKSFSSFERDLKKYEGREIEELKKMIGENTDWFDDVKDLRDDFIIHHPAARHTLEFRDGVAYIPLTTTKKGHDQRHIVLDAIARSISIEKIDSILSQLKELLKKLNEYFYKNIHMLPFEAKYCRNE